MPAVDLKERRKTWLKMQEARGLYAKDRMVGGRLGIALDFIRVRVVRSSGAFMEKRRRRCAKS